MQILGQGQQIILVLQQNKGLPGDLFRKLLMLLAMEHLRKQSLVHIGILKQAQQHLGPQHTAGSLLHHGAVHPAAFYQIADAVLPDFMGEVMQFHIKAGFHGQLDGIFLGIRHIEPVVQTGNGGHIRPDKAPHTPLVTEDFGEDLVIHGHRLVAHAGIGAHHIHGAGILHRCLEHRQAVGKDFVAAHGAGGAVQTGNGATVSGVVLQFAGNRIGGGQIIALHALDARSGKLGSQEGILAVGLFRPAEPGIPHQVHNGAPHLVDAAGPGFGGDHMAHLPGHFRIKGGCQADLLGEDGGTHDGCAVDAFAVEQQRNAQPGLLHRPALEGVANFGAEGADGADAHAMELFLGLFQRELPIASGTLQHIRGAKLVGLHNKLIQGHAADEIIQPLFHIELGILIRQHRGYLLFIVFFIIA